LGIKSSNPPKTVAEVLENVSEDSEELFTRAAGNLTADVKVGAFIEIDPIPTLESLADYFNERSNLKAEFLKALRAASTAASSSVAANIVPSPRDLNGIKAIISSLVLDLDPNKIDTERQTLDFMTLVQGSEPGSSLLKTEMKYSFGTVKAIDLWKYFAEGYNAEAALKKYAQEKDLSIVGDDISKAQGVEFQYMLIRNGVQTLGLPVDYVISQLGDLGKNHATLWPLFNETFGPLASNSYADRGGQAKVIKDLKEGPKAGMTEPTNK
jgi:hypothetical protein